MNLSATFDNLETLLNNNSRARDFYNSLTELRQSNVNKYSNHIHNEKDLKMYGELLLKGGND